MKPASSTQGKERTFPADQQLVSSTDAKGIIRYCNDNFVNISGFTREELIGSPHNIVRHPDMPAEAFKLMWSYISQGKPWMGLVKNRCKNGDYYWVDAYVTPIFQNGKISGYESVRRKPRPEDVARAEKLYARLKSGQGLTRQTQFRKREVLLLIAAIAAILVSSIGLQWLGLDQLWLTAILGAVIAYGTLWVSTRRDFTTLLGYTPHSFKDQVAMLTYTDAAGLFGQLKMAIISDASHLNTVVTRLEHSAQDVAVMASEAHVLSVQAAQGMRDQQEETAQVAAAMHEMSATISEVSGHVQETAGEAESVEQMSKEGAQVAVQTREAILHLRERVTSIAVAVDELSQQSRAISGTTELIEKIAEQTNLLALNAAIESARAGEHGRGFAVVADEVRQLALRTRESTHQIQAIVQQLQVKADAALEVAGQGEEEARAGAEQVQLTETRLHEISGAVSRIAGMTVQMATAIEQQASVADEINRQIENINHLAGQSLEKGTESSERSKQLEVTAEHLYELVERFKR